MSYGECLVSDYTVVFVGNGVRQARQLASSGSYVVVILFVLQSPTTLLFS